MTTGFSAAGYPYVSIVEPSQRVREGRSIALSRRARVVQRTIQCEGCVAIVWVVVDRGPRAVKS